MKRRILAFVLAAISVFTISCSKGGEAKKGSDQVLNLFTWEGMFPDEVLKGFEKETGIRVQYSNFDTDETMLTKLQAAKGGDYDVIIADDYIIEMAIKENLVGKIDFSKVPNAKNINPHYQSQFYDKTNEYTIPYGAGVQTIIYDPSVVKIPITGYADLWNPALKDSIAITENYRVIDGMALKVDGDSYNTEDVAKIEKAGKKLLELAPNIRLINDNNAQDFLISKEVSVGVFYTSQTTLAMLANPDLKIVYPKEGIGFGIMANFVPVNAPHKDAAYKFMDYILRPEVSAKCFEFLGYFCTNKAAEPLISDKMKPYIILDENRFKNAEMIQLINAQATDAHEKIWTEFKRATGAN